MSLWQTFKRYFNIAYRSSKVGMSYEEIPGSGATKAIIESISAVLVLYASYSELSDKLLKAFSLEQSNYASIIGRITTCVLGIFVCLHILFSTKTEKPNIFAYSRIPRLFAGVIIWLVLISLGTTIFDMFSQAPTSLGTNESYYDLSAKAWQRKPNSDNEATVRTYIYQLNIPDEYKNKYKDIKVFIAPSQGFILKNVSPIAKESKAIQRNQEPLEAGKFENLRSEWLFPEFDSSNEWKLLVTVGTNNSEVRFSNEAPLKATVYFYR
jgi:hypothetical protein